MIVLERGLTFFLQDQLCQSWLIFFEKDLGFQGERVAMSGERIYFYFLPSQLCQSWLSFSEKDLEFQGERVAMSGEMIYLFFYKASYVKAGSTASMARPNMAATKMAGMMCLNHLACDFKL